MMRIREQSPARLVLSGVPGGVLWMILLVGLGTLLSAVVGVLAVWIWQESGGLVWSHAPLALGLLIAQVLFWTGVVTLAEGVEMVMPGDNVSIEAELITPIAMDTGLRFAIREGGRTVGAGVSREIIG